MAARKRAAKPAKDDAFDAPFAPEEISSDQAAPERVTVVTEVVEVVEGVDPVEDAQEVEKNEESSEEKQKDVVEGLFRRDTPTLTPEITIHKENKRLPLGLWVAIVVVVAVLVGGGLIWATGSAGSLGALTSAKPTPTPIQTPAPTAMPQVSRSDITVQVLNGGGAVGAAGRMRTYLEEKGYTVSGTGNTSAYTHETTEIVVKPGKEAYMSLLKTDLESDYTLGTVSATLSADASYDAQVIVGKDE